MIETDSYEDTALVRGKIDTRPRLVIGVMKFLHTDWRLTKYNNRLRELVMWLGENDVQLHQKMRVVMVKSAFAHAFFEGACN